MTVKKKAEKYITPLRMNKLHGRMMRLPPKSKNKEILLVYGHHSSLERVYGFADYLNRYGAVTVPDLPGFGGMESFYKLGRQPTVEALADYLASFIKMQYKRRRIVIVGMSFSTPIITQMLQKYPSIAKKVDLHISYVGFVHKDDFKVNKIYLLAGHILSSIFSQKIPASLVRMFMLRKRLLSLMLNSSPWMDHKLAGLSDMKKKEIIEFEIELWKINDFRTRAKTIKEMLTLDLCNKKVDMPIYQISVNSDRYFDDAVVEQHMRIIFSDFEQIQTDMLDHAPSILAEAQEISKIVPNRARQLLRKA